MSNRSEHTPEAARLLSNLYLSIRFFRASRRSPTHHACVMSSPRPHCSHTPRCPHGRLHKTQPTNTSEMMLCLQLSHKTAPISSQELHRWGAMALKRLSIIVVFTYSTPHYCRLWAISDIISVLNTVNWRDYG